MLANTVKIFGMEKREQIAKLSMMTCAEQQRMLANTVKIFGLEKREQIAKLFMMTRA